MPIFEDLLKELQHPEATRRVVALRILGMVEETRALKAILEVYQSDPDLAVREVADWAGDLIWKAHRRAQTAETGPVLPEAIDRSAIDAEDVAYKASRLIAGMMLDAGRDANLQNDLSFVTTEWERLDLVAEQSAKRPTRFVPAFATDDANHLDLLDLGLSDEFLRMARMTAAQPGDEP